MSEPKVIKLGKNTRRSYSKIDEVLEMPNLIEVQKNSYKWFLEEGLQGRISHHQLCGELNFGIYRLHFR